MTEREELVELTGQAINGILSADSSMSMKVIDDMMHEQIAEFAVKLASSIQKQITSELKRRHENSRTDKH